MRILEYLYASKKFVYRKVEVGKLNGLKPFFNFLLARYIIFDRVNPMRFTILSCKIRRRFLTLFDNSSQHQDVAFTQQYNQNSTTISYLILLSPPLFNAGVVLEE